MFCVVSTNSLTMAPTGAIRPRHSHDGGIQWLWVKPRMCFIGRCAPRCTTASPSWPSKLSSICLHFLSHRFRCWPQPWAKDHVMVNIKNIQITNMFISMLWTYSYCFSARRRWWMPFRPPFLTACKQFTENTSSSRINLFKRLFYPFILNQAKAFLPNPFQRGCPRPIGGGIQRYHAVEGANCTTMVVMFVG